MHTSRGVTAIEMVFGVSIAALVLMYSLQAIAIFMTTGRDIGEKTQALYLAEDGLELVRYVRDDSWSTISGLPLNTPRYLDITNTTIDVTATPEVVGGYSRSFRISNVYRDASDDIVASTTPGSVADPSAKYVTVDVTWGSPSKTVSLTSILADLDP